MNSHPNSSNSTHKLRPLDALVRDARFLLHRRRAGKIAKLPPAIREQINIMLQDGVPYVKIIATLGEAAQGINIHNLSRWRRADYQDWLDQQTWREGVPQNKNASPQTKDLTLLLHNLDSQPLDSAESLRKSAWVRHVNLVCKHIDRMAAQTTLKPGTMQSAPSGPVTAPVHSQNNQLKPLKTSPSPIQPISG